MRNALRLTVVLGCVAIGVTATATERTTVFDKLFLLDSHANNSQAEATRLAANVAQVDAQLQAQWRDMDTAARAAAPIRHDVTAGFARWLGASRVATREAFDGPHASRDTQRLLQYAAPRALPAKLRDVDVVRRADFARDEFALLMGRRAQWSVDLARNQAIAGAALGSRDVLVQDARAGRGDDTAVTTAAFEELLAGVPQRAVAGDFHRAKGTLARPVTLSPTHRFGETGALVRPTGWTYRPDADADVHAIHDGVVVFRGVVQGHGLVVVIDHASGYRSTVNHLAAANVEVDDVVKRAQVIGAAGESGSIDGVRLHFSLRSNGVPVDPDGWFLRR